MLAIGSRDRLQVRRERLDLGAGVEVLYASDLHLTRWTPHIVSQLVEVVAAVRPGLVLLGGDLIDLRNGLPLLAACIRAIDAPVWAIDGNHDRRVGVAAVRACVEEAGGRWLSGVEHFHGLRISGSCDAEAEILCAHEPDVFPAAAARGVRLVLAGHLHGGQWVLGGTQRWYPAALFYRWNGPRFTQGASTMLVSRGLHDTLPVRWNCPREVILCRI